MRDNKWLESQLRLLLKNHFSDVKLTNPVEIKFGREAKYRFGSIRLIKARSKFSILPSQFSIGRKVPQKTIITITSMFAKENIPVDVIRYTIAHELCHYAHGFSSANRRLFKYPHHGGIVNRELKDRGADDLIVEFKKWLKIYRKQILKGRVSV
ncbi:M48 family metallopeptidase [Candidatus Curtissbacteria bacterium]|nr:M48 family metallopeptidase [Candidatus Curtissbacteria bacterium]